MGLPSNPAASSEGPPKLDLPAQGISLYSCLNLNNLVLNNNTMVIACMGPKLHLNNVQELTQTNKGQERIARVGSEARQDVQCGRS